MATKTAPARSKYLVVIITKDSSLLLSCGRVSLFHDLTRQLGIHGLGAAPGGFDGDIVLLAELAEEMILAGKLVRHFAFRPVYFIDHSARVRRNLLVQREAI